jgi:hypothetical protein
MVHGEPAEQPRLEPSGDLYELAVHRRLAIATERRIARYG